MAEITRQMKREAALREVKMRRSVYPRWVKDGRMTQAVADREIATMEAIAADYAEPDLFEGAPI
jgi:hypothetical protein